MAFGYLSLWVGHRHSASSERHLKSSEWKEKAYIIMDTQTNFIILLLLSSLISFVANLFTV